MGITFIRLIITMSTILVYLQGIDAVTFTVASKTIEEDSIVGYLVATLTASDGTAPYTYAIQGTVAKFELDTTDTSLLKVKATLDYEATPSYTLTITAVDKASTPVTATATMTISINPNTAPAFSQPTYVFSTLIPNAPADTSIGNVTATDVNTGVNKLSSFAIASGNTDSTFAITKTDGNGEIKVATGKTATETSYTLTIHAIDGGTPPLSATATVSIGYPSGATTNCLGLILLVGAFVIQAIKYI